MPRKSTADGKTKRKRTTDNPKIEQLSRTVLQVSQTSADLTARLPFTIDKQNLAAVMATR